MAGSGAACLGRLVTGWLAPAGKSPGSQRRSQVGFMHSVDRGLWIVGVPLWVLLVPVTIFISIAAWRYSVHCRPGWWVNSGMVAGANLGDAGLRPLTAPPTSEA